MEENVKNLFKNFVSPRFFFQIAILAVMPIVLFACQQEQEPQTRTEVYKGFSYTINLTGEIVITDYSGISTDINIPSHIENRPVGRIRGRDLVINHNNPNNSIYTEAALENKNLYSVILPATLRIIEDGAFANNNLTEIQLPSNLTWLGAWAFMNNQLRSIVIPDSIWHNIGSQAFEGNQITNVTFGNGVKRIEYAAFRNNKITQLTLPPNISHIGISAFASNKIEELNLAYISCYISMFAFEDNLLSNLIIPANSNIAAGAFKDNIITRLNIGENVYIEYGAFIGNFITHINVGENVHFYGPPSSPVFPVFELGFDEFFLGNKSKAGTYLYENGKWEFMPGT